MSDFAWAPCVTAHSHPVNFHYAVKYESVARQPTKSTKPQNMCERGSAGQLEGRDNMGPVGEAAAASAKSREQRGLWNQSRALRIWKQELGLMLFIARQYAAMEFWSLIKILSLMMPGQVTKSFQKVWQQKIYMIYDKYMFMCGCDNKEKNALKLTF